MKLMHTSRAKVLTSVVSALLLALVLQPACALATTAAEVTYTTDGNGSVKPASEWVEFDTYIYEGVDRGWTSPDTGEYLWAASISTWPTITTYPDGDKGYDAVDYWTADVDVFIPYPGYEGVFVKRISAGQSISDFQIADGPVYVYRDTKFTVHFKKTFATTYTITYKTDGNGTVEPASETVQDGNKAVGPTKVEAKDGFEFEYWTADVAVTLSDGTSIKAGDPIISDEIPDINVTSAITFTAHFKEKGSDPVTPDSDSDDSSDKVKPADGTSDKVLPKTGSTLPGVGVAIALCAGSVITAGVLFARKRSSQE